MASILLPVNSGRIAFLGDLFHGCKRKARLDPFTTHDLAGLDAEQGCPD